MTGICVAHLVREANGPAPFEAFLGSYRAHPAGVAHDLLVVFKGFGTEEVPEPYGRLLRGLDYDALFVPDEGFDVAPYFAAARARRQDYLCFLNSFSVILSDGWLAKMSAHARAGGVGVVGATGSCESHYTNYAGWRARDALRLAWRAGWGAPPRAGLREAARYRAQFPAFPNPHVRTNAFLIRRAVMLRLRAGALSEKRDAHRFESGRGGMTRQIAAMGLRPLVVGRDGRAYEQREWYESRTFRSGDQENLLIADNQTRYYERADAPTRRQLTWAAWGRA
jgi:hypothetical protein